MLKKSFLYSFLLISLCVNGQSYEPFVKDGGTWIVITVRDGGYPILRESLQYRMIGDTLINSRVYKVLYESGVDTSFIPNPDNIIAFIREDTSKRVYVLDALDSISSSAQFGCHYSDSLEEYLLYDFGLDIGDTMWVFDKYNSTDSLYYTPELIDTLIISGVQRRRMNMRRTLEQGDDTWVEGIGSMNGIYFPYCLIFETGWYLGCYYDSKILYQEDPTRTCEALNVREKYEEGQMLVYPNPNYGLFTLKLDKLSSGEIKIFNTIGKIVYREAFSNQSSFEIQLPHKISDGVYLVQLVIGVQRSSQRMVVLRN